MIRLEYQPKPAALTAKFVAAQTQEFKKSGKNVWNRDEIKEALLKMSNSKCCYCECAVNKEGSYMEVEHWLPKKHHPDSVLLWENLFPSCKRCNGNKSEHDTALSPILHPVKDNPVDHLKLKHYRLYPKTVLGECSIKELYLNDPTMLTIARYEIGSALINELEDLEEKAIELWEGKRKQTKRLIQHLERLMIHCLPDKVYCATKATILLNENSYQTIKNIFNQHQLWTPQFQELEDQIKACALELG